MTKILVINGPNLTYLGKRQPELYGTTTAAELDDMLRAHAAENGYALDIFYTHVEGHAIERVYQAVEQGFDALVMNPAGMTYAGYAMRDCLLAVEPDLPYVEVHITHIERLGKRSVTAEPSIGMIFGFGVKGYLLGLDAALMHLGKK